MSSLNVSSREKLDMDLSANETNHRGKFNPSQSPQSKHRNNGFLIKRWVFFSLLLIAVGCIVGVGLIVGYLNHRSCACFGDHTTPVLNCSNSAKNASRQIDPTASPSDRINLRLPKSVLPEHYDVLLQPYIGPEHFYFDGNVTIAIICQQNTNSVTLHINDLIIHNDTVILEDNSGTVIPIANLTHDVKVQFFIIHLKEMLQNGKRYSIRISFKGNLNDDLAGFYRTSYKDINGQKRWSAVTQFQPTDARRAFPCFDEPALKATFTITMVHYRNMTAISNMPLMNSIERGDWIEDTFQKTVKMSTYLLAFFVSEYESRTNHTANFTVWSRKESIDTANFSLEIGPKLLNFYDEFFNIPYPLPKMDMIAVPDFNAGAMENWGLIVYRETAMLYDPRESSTSNLMRVGAVVAHELAHQWFGNLVTPKWWDDLWLNEGFASYMEYFALSRVHPKWEMFQQFVVDELQDVFELDCLTSSHPISVPVHNPDEINEIFDRISYGKGASIIRMMNHFLGEDKFRRGVSNYLNAFRYDSAVQDDLWNYLTETTNNNINVRVVMTSWTLQDGYPVVTLTRNYKKREASLTQKRFLLTTVNDSTEIDSNKYTWEIPITYTDARDPNWIPDTKLWMHQSSPANAVSIPNEHVPEETHWMIANVQEVGYYRVNYDLNNWKLIIEQLLDDHRKIHPINRGQIIDDALDLAQANLLDYRVALNTTKYLVHEKEYIPWEAAINGFSFLDKMLRRSAAYGRWKTHVMNLINNLYSEIGWDIGEENDNTLPKLTQVNAIAWACKYGNDDCIEQSLKRFRQWKSAVKSGNNQNPIHPNLRSVIYCVGIEYGKEDDWEFLWQLYLTSQVATEKDKLMRSLSCTREPWILNRYIERAFNSSSGIRKQDGNYVFRVVATSNHGRDIAFNFMRDKWDLIHKYYGKSVSFGGMIKSVTSSLNTEFELKQIEEFYEKVKDNLGTAQRSFKQAIEQTKSNVKWTLNHYPVIDSWLSDGTTQASR